MNGEIETKTGIFEMVRGDPAFLCSCGCGKRIKHGNKYFSKECIYKMRFKNPMGTIEAEEGVFTFLVLSNGGNKKQ